jgi:NADH-quinone oxidoreductase subunit A
LLSQYAAIALYSIVAILFVVTTIVLPIFLKYLGVVKSKPSAVKNEPFECGMETMGKTHVRFNFRYYFFALLFVSLDIMVLFVYPWAVGVKNLGTAGLTAILIMLGLISVGYVYAWKKKAFEWK